MANVAESNAAFEAAYQSFFNSLSEDERLLYSPCTSATHLLHGLHKLDALAKKSQKQRRGRFLMIIKSFSEKLEPFFDVISIFVQSKPEYFAIVWGSLRLVLNLASNFVTFLEKLIRVIERLASSLPQYADIVMLHNSSPSVSSSPASLRMKSHIEKVYTELLGFFQSVTRVFSKGGSKIRKTPAVMCDLMWTPFDTRFSELIERMNYHRTMVGYEVEIMQAYALSSVELSASWLKLYAAEQCKLAAEERKRAEKVANMTSNMRDSLERQQQDLVFERIHRWLSPSNFNEVFESSQELREEGAGDWIFKKPEFVAWKSSAWSIKQPSSKTKLSPNVLWFHGNPGYGKSVLASYVIEELQSDSSNPSSKRKTLFFFFRSDRSDATSPSSAYRALLSQILFASRTNNEMMEKFAFARDETSAGQLTASPMELISLLQICLSSMEQTYLIFDGIDKCDNASSLSQVLLWVGAHSDVKTLLFSRPNVRSLQKTVPHSQRTTVDRFSMSADTELFVTRQLTMLIDDKLLAPTADPSSLVNRLFVGADGMFLWARLMMNYLHSPVLTPNARLRVMLDVVLPEGLEQMYNRILQLIMQASRIERDLARKVFAWLLHSVRPLDLQSLQAALMADEDISNDDTADTEATAASIKALNESIVSVCGGLVEVHGSLQFIHLSVKQHLTQVSLSVKRNETSPGIILYHTAANFELANRCIEHLGHETMPTHYNSWQYNNFTQYAALFWPDHLVHAIPAQDSAEDEQSAMVRLVSSIQRFLNDPRAISRWIHAYYCIKSKATYVLDLGAKHLEAWVLQISGLRDSSDSLQQLIRLLGQFAHDLRLLVSSWGFKLLQNPSLIWDEVPAFLPSRFLTPGSTMIESMAPSKPQLAGSSTKPLCSVSVTTRDGLRTGVLSIWPCRMFEDHWDSLGLHYQTTTYQLCDSWIAKYEVWAVDSKVSRLVDMALPLDKDEVNLLLRQSFRQEHADGWKSSFPLAISDDLRSIVILRTLHVFRLGTATTPASVKSVVIPMDFANAVQAKWRDETRAFDMKRVDLRDMPPALKYIQTDWYHYSFAFSPGGRYLTFWDCHRFDHRHHLAVYELNNDDDISLRLLNWSSITSFLVTPYSSVLHVGFHPVYDLLVFQRRDTTYLWHFREDFQKCTISTSEKHNGFDADFSSCGNFLLLSKQGLPTFVSPISPLELSRAQENLQASEGSSTPEMSIQDKERLTTVGNVNVSAFQLHEGQVVQGPHLAIGKGNQIAATTTVTAGHSCEIYLESQTPLKCRQAIDIITFPQQYKVGSAMPTVKLPQNGDTTLRVILDQASRPDYSMKDCQHLSHVVIDRDIDKIKHTLSLVSPPLAAHEKSNKRSRPLYTDPNQNKVVGADNEEQDTHAYDTSDQIIAEVVDREVLHDAKRLKEMTGAVVKKPILWDS